MRRWVLIIAVTALAALRFAGAGAAPIGENTVAPDFTKNELDSPDFGQTTPRSLSDYAGKVVVLFLMGYS